MPGGGSVGWGAGPSMRPSSRVREALRWVVIRLL